MEPIPANSKKLTYFQKDEVKCPVCSGKFRREALLSGSGRLLAGDLLPDLRRIYKPSPRFGLANPLIYSI
ncbi:MAG TPA: DUF2225 domain-containing protein, partial [Spirochaetia bacterium]|nr:DUF2225 domain-containing protein [Spirochaetia bacterium]